MILAKIIEFSLYVLIFSLPFSKSIIEISAITAIIAWIVKRSLEQKSIFKIFPRTELNKPILFFSLFTLLSLFGSSYPALSTRAFITKFAEYILLYFIIFDTAKDKGIARNMMKVFAASVLLVVLNGLYQKIIGFDFVRNYALFSQQYITSSFEFPNGLGAWTLIAVFPFLGLGLFLKGNVKIKVTCLLLSISLIIMLLSTANRGAILSFAFGALLILLLRRGPAAYILLTIFIIAVLFAGFVILHEGERFGLSDNLLNSKSISHRLEIWQVGWSMFMDRPFLGQGLNTFMSNYKKFATVSLHSKELWYAHNCYLQIAAEIGIFGLISFLWMVGKAMVSSFKSWRSMNSEFLGLLCLGLSCGITSFLIQSAIDTSLYSLKLVLFFYVTLGFLMGIRDTGYNNG